MILACFLSQTNYRRLDDGVCSWNIVWKMQEGNGVMEFSKLVAIAISGFRSASNKIGNEEGNFESLLGSLFQKSLCRTTILCTPCNDSPRTGSNYYY